MKVFQIDYTLLKVYYTKWKFNTEISNSVAFAVKMYRRCVGKFFIYIFRLLFIMDHTRDLSSYPCPLSSMVTSWKPDRIVARTRL